jgi:hypothetical protein
LAVHFPFSKNLRNDYINRFEPDKNLSPDLKSRALKSPGFSSLGNNKKMLMDGHNRQLVKILEKDAKTREVICEAEERLGAKLEKER